MIIARNFGTNKAEESLFRKTILIFLSAERINNHTSYRLIALINWDLANYVGCIRVLSIGQKKDKEKVRRQLEISTIDSHGDVNKQECPVN